MKLRGKVALVTGSARGIGRAVADKLAAEGARLVINDVDAQLRSRQGRHRRDDQEPGAGAGRYNVNVNAVAFGLIGTRMTQAVGPAGARVDVGGRPLPAGIPEAARRAIEAQIPLGRAGTPEEAAGATYLFCIPESDYVSGQVLLVTGGQ